MAGHGDDEYPSRARRHRVTQFTLVIREFTMINWPEMLRHAEDWADGFWAGAASVSLIVIAGATFALLVRAI